MPLSFHFIRNLSRPRGSHTQHKHTQTNEVRLMCLYMIFCCLSLIRLLRAQFKCVLWCFAFYHFNFITILIANNDLKNEKNRTINTTLIWHL